MSWFVGSGNPIRKGGVDNGWTYMRSRYEQLLKSGNPHCYFRAPIDKGHELTMNDSLESAQYFHLTDLVLAPFLYVPDWSGKFAKIAADANRRRFSSALRAIAVAEKTGSDKYTETARELRDKIEGRVQELVDLSEELLETDVVLADFYIPIILKQIKGLPEEKTLGERFREAKSSSDYKKVIQLNKQFRSEFPRMFGAKYGAPGYGKLYPQYVRFLEACAKFAGEKSQLGKMAGDFLKQRRN